MSDSAQTPPGEPRPRSGTSGDAQEAQLFSTLFATKPARQRKLGPWLFAAALHLPLLFFFFTTDMGHRVLDRAQLLMLPVVLDDTPAPITTPVQPEVKVAAEPVRPRMPPVEEEQRPTVSTERPIRIEPVPGPVISGAPAVPPGVVPGTSSGTPRTLLDRLDGPPIDSRLIAPPNPGSLVTGVETSRDRLAASIAAYNDSVQSERAALARATDWTVADKDGNRWGVSPGQLHLGKLTLPLPVAFATPPGRRDDVNARTRSWTDIETQASRAEIKDSFQDRVKEIRKRKEAEREAAKKKGSS